MRFSFYSLLCVIVFLTLSLASARAQISTTNYDEEFDDADFTYEEQVYDPLEGVNRVFYKFNTIFRRVIIKPVVKTYRFILPQAIRQNIRNALRNLTEPVTFANTLLQGDIKHAAVTFWRFTINTTLGAGGLADVASLAGLHHRQEDFGQTLGVYNSGTGPYLVLPILGPSNVRDLIGLGGDILMDPFTYENVVQDDFRYARAGLELLDRFDQRHDFLEETDATNLDPYSTLRSYYTQKRDDEIKSKR